MNSTPWTSAVFHCPPSRESLYENSTWSPSIAIRRLLLIATRFAYRARYSTVLFAASRSCGLLRSQTLRTRRIFTTEATETTEFEANPFTVLEALR